jgi:hypothetical protein
MAATGTSRAFDVCAQAGAVNEESIALVDPKASMRDQGGALDAQSDAMNRQKRQRGEEPPSRAVLRKGKRSFAMLCVPCALPRPEPHG